MKPPRCAECGHALHLHTGPSPNHPPGVTDLCFWMKFDGSASWPCTCGQMREHQEQIEWTSP